VLKVGLDVPLASAFSAPVFEVLSQPVNQLNLFASAAFALTGESTGRVAPDNAVSKALSE
jgi:hypothetical protein